MNLNTYDQVLKHIKRFKKKKIVVTGPQRAGTTITTKILAHDLGYPVFYEEDIRTDRYPDAVNHIASNDTCVIQGTGLAHAAHRFRFKDAFIVYMWRDLDSIRLSEIRINWSDRDERLKYRYAFPDIYDEVKPIAKIKYEAWQKQQVTAMFAGKDYINLDYYSLEGHPLHIKKPNRVNFGARQTQ